MGHHDTALFHTAGISAELLSDHVLLHWADGEAARFHYRWLRDNCRKPGRFDPATQERKALTETIPGDLHARSVSIGDDTITLSWSDGEEDSVFPASWLRRNAYDTPSAPVVTTRSWGACYGAHLARHDYATLMHDDEAAAAMIRDFEAHGLVRLSGVPVADREVVRFAERLAYVREIVFDRVADIRVAVDPYTIGFTNAALPLHTDCSGYSWPPNVMVFHCLANEVSGGASQYVDGVRVVEQLRRDDPQALAMLTEHPVEFRLWSRQADTLSRFPPIILDENGDLAVLRYANWAVQPLRTIPFDLVPAWYDAWNALAEKVNDPANRLAYRCDPGELLVINNHRVLHGRDAFDDGEGVRHFQQVYMELDDLSGFRRIVDGHGGAR